MWSTQYILHEGAHLQKTKHGLSYIETMSPVVVSDVTVASSYCVHPSGEDLKYKKYKKIIFPRQVFFFFFLSKPWLRTLSQRLALEMGCCKFKTSE